MDVAQQLRVEHTLAGLHPTAVTPDGVDFTVVGQQTEGLCQTPCGECIGGETGVNESQSRSEIVVGKVGEILSYLQRREHTLIDDALGRQRADVEILVADALLDLLPYNIKDAVEGFHLVVAHARDEHLLDIGFVAQCRLTQTIGVGGHVAQVHQRESLALDLLDHHGEDFLLFLCVFRQEHESRTILSFLWNWYSLQENKLMRNLQEDTRTVTGLSVGSLCTSMAHVLKYFQRIVYQFMALVAVDINHHAHTTRIVFVLGTIQSFFIHNLFDFNTIKPLIFLSFCLQNYYI